MPSVEAVFCPRQAGSAAGAGGAPASLFPRVHDEAETATSRAASVRPQDVPDVLRRMSEMQVFSRSAVAAAAVNGEAGASSSTEKAPPAAAAAAAVREPDQAAIVYDVDALRAGFAAVKRAFPPHWNHCLAIKSCPLSFVIREALDAGLGIEAASFVELYLGLAHGCPPALVAFDSPAKTNEELEMALGRGTLVNANSLVELDRIAAIIERQQRGPSPPAVGPRVGIRLNPLIGAGSLAELSVSVATSKFAVPSTAANVSAVVDAFRRWPWLVALHTHVGSQGYSLDQLSKGIAALCDIADLVDGELGEGRVELLDIGGGLPASYDSDEVTPSFDEYASVLRGAAPSLFENTRRTVLTEFGRTLVAKSAMTVSTVEYVRTNTASDDDTPTTLPPPPPPQAATGDGGEQASSPEHQTLVVHVGADLFLRASYLPEKYAHRLSMYDGGGSPLAGPPITTDVAGPLCFQGDYVARGASLPRAAPGDLMVVHDTGANTLSLFSRHCSRRAPAVYGYTRDGAAGGGGVCVRLVKERESVGDVARFWGTW